MRLWIAVVAGVFTWTNLASAQVPPPGPVAMSSVQIDALQRRLADMKCYTGLIDGRPSEALTKALAACPNQFPVLRIETEMHVAPIRRASADARCTLLATGSHDKTVRLWSMPEGRLLRTQRLPIDGGDVGRIHAVAVSRDGKWVAAAGWISPRGVPEGLYLFDAATGQTMRRLGAFRETVSSLAFSPDGTRIAAAIDGGEGVRILDVENGRELSADRDFTDQAAVAFAPDGTLLAVGADGFIRRYALNGRRLAKVAARGGKQAISLAVDPSGRRVAVSFSDGAAVDLFELPDLRFAGAADTSGIANVSLMALAWDADGTHLFAGGGRWDRGKRLRVFRPDGTRDGADISPSESTMLSLAPCGSGVVFAAADPSFGYVAADGTVARLRRSATANMRAKTGNSFTISEDGARLRFGLGQGETDPVLFDVGLRTLATSPSVPDGLRGALTAGLPVTDYEDALVPRFDGRQIPLPKHEESRTLAVRADKKGFLLGTDYSVRAFDRGGRQLWVQGGLGTAWGLNLAQNSELIVVAYDDGTVRWRRWSDGKELLALFVNRETRAWVASTPTGYYSASPGAEDMIGWHVNRGWDQAADFFPASKFRDTYARADIVARVLDTLDEAEAIRQANAARPDRKEAKPITDLLPPVVAILSPAEGASVTGDELRVDYLVRSPAGLPVDAVEALVDGRPASRERGLGRPEQADTLRDCLAGTRGLGRTEGGGLQGCRGSITVRLPPGANEIGLFARTGDRAGDIAKIRIVRAAAEAAGTVAQKPKLYALVVGISAYANADYTLQYAAKDAQDFSAALLNQKNGFYDDVTVRRVTDGEATKNGILDGLDWLTKQVTNRDVGLVYLAGHGVLDDRDRFYFVAADSDIDRLRTTGVPREDIQDALDALPGKALLFLDACHAGAVGLSKVRRESVDINGVANEFTRTERGVVMFTASTGKQVSQENAAWGNGAFTKAVIEGLGTPGQRGKADLLGKGTISTSALDVYVSERVKELTGGRQSPVMIRPSTVPDFTLAAVR